MNNKTKNPPAFAAGCADGYWIQEGMSLRDYFAGIALAALLTQGAARKVNDLDWPARAYQVADLMLIAREQNNASND